MKVLTLNFLTCAVKACKSSPNSHPLHPKDAELVQDDIDLNPEMIINVLPRLDWQALRTTSSEVCFFPMAKHSCITYPLPLLGLMHLAQLT
jgi:multifunctional methyltransferase subunit TRM112